MKRPFGTYMIGFLYTLSGIGLFFGGIFALLDNDWADRIGIVTTSEQIFGMFFGLLMFFAVYAYMSMEKWGFWAATTCFSLFFIWKIFMILSEGSGFISLSFLLPILSLIQIIVFKNEYGKEKNK